LDVFSTIYEWIDKGGGAQDALGDPELFDAMNNFLGTYSITKIPDATSADGRPMWAELENTRQNTLALYKTQTQRPKLQTSAARDSVTVSSVQNFGPHPLAIDDIDPETLVDNLDALAATAMHSVTQEVKFVALAHNTVLMMFDRISLLPSTFWKSSLPIAQDGSYLTSLVQVPMRWKSRPYIHICSKLSQLFLYPNSAKNPYISYFLLPSAVLYARTLLYVNGLWPR
jgi:hypothetical protein